MQRLAQLTVAASGYTTRTETFDGRDHLVVPVVALVEGVVHAMNAKNAEFVSASEFSRAPGGWNGRPLFFGHPLSAKGAPVSGNTPAVLEAKSIGRIFNASIKSAKLAMEAWIDVDKAKEIAPEILERVEAGETIEISVGVFVDTDEAEGEYQGRKYLGEWHDIVPIIWRCCRRPTRARAVWRWGAAFVPQNSRRPLWLTRRRPNASPRSSASSFRCSGPRSLRTR
jgi:hypothetical protein